MLRAEAQRTQSGRRENGLRMMDTFWSDARAQMLLDPEVINLNTGSFGPQPRVVFERATQLRRRLAEEPMDFFVRQVPALLWPHAPDHVLPEIALA